MTKHLSAYVNDVLPGHSVRPIRRSEQNPGPTTVVAHFADIDAASRAAVTVVDEPGSDVDVVAILRPPRDPALGAGAPSASESIDQTSVARVETWGTVGGLIGALVTVAVCIVADTAAAVGVITAFYGFGLGYVIGGTIGGIGRFGSEHAREETPNRASDPVGGAVAVHAADNASAEAIAHRIIACDGAMDVRVVDEDGFWHAPYSDQLTFGNRG